MTVDPLSILSSTPRVVSCVKGIIFKGDQFSVQRLALKSEPWGGAKLQDNMIAVTGLKVFYIISLTEELTLHNTVHTRKDYWGICALSPINLACRLGAYLILAVWLLLLLLMYLLLLLLLYLLLLLLLFFFLLLLLHLLSFMLLLLSLLVLLRWWWW